MNKTQLENEIAKLFKAYEQAVGVIEEYLAGGPEGSGHYDPEGAA